MNIITRSTAESIIADQAARGRAREDIGPAELAETYALHAEACAEAGYPRPDFGAVRAMLAASSVPEAPHTGPVAIIVETRQHAALEPVIDEVVSQLDIPVQFFHGHANAEQLRHGKLATLIESGRLTATPLDDTLPLDKARYNALLMLPDFWERMIGRGRILVFQTDAILCPASPYRLEDFDAFDYIGSPLSQRTWHGLTFHGGNGGLSLHGWHSTMECLKRFPPEAWASAEDRYYAFHMEFVGRVGRFHDCARFSAQREFLYPSFGAHNVREMPAIDQAQFLKYCPEARRILLQVKPLPRSPLRRWKRALARAWMRRQPDRSVRLGSAQG